MAMEDNDRLQLHRPTVVETVRMTEALSKLVDAAKHEDSSMLQIKLVRADLEDVDSITDLAGMVGEELGITVAAELSLDQRYINVAIMPDMFGDLEK
jgi:hypothetical protein